MGNSSSPNQNTVYIIVSTFTK